MGKYHEYYDKLNLGKKDYGGEVTRICQMAQCHDKILEVGCGTGNHTLYLCKVAEVAACDVDPEMLAVASAKLNGLPVSLHRSIDEVPNQEYDLCVMLWNVLNYFPNINTINAVFAGVCQRLKSGALFMFDMWNGVAVIRDLPRTSVNNIVANGLTIHHRLVGETSLMDQRTIITNHITAHKNGMPHENFSHEVIHYIWTVNTIRNLLVNNGFEVVRVAKTSNYELEATADDWNVMIIARK